MKRKPILAFLATMLSLDILSAQTGTSLDALWNSALETNVDVREAETEATSAGIRRRFYASNYAPSLVVNGSNTFAPNPQREEGTLSDASTFSLMYGKPFSSGAILNATLAYSLSRPFTPGGTYTVQSPGLTVSLSQGLNPWWSQGLKEDPVLSALDNAILSRDIALVRQKKSVLVALTRNYIELRRIDRSLELLEQTIALRLETLASLRILFEEGAISMTKIWDEKQLLMDDENALVQNRGERERLNEQLRAASGIDVVNASRSALPLNGAARQYPANLDAADIDTQLTSLSLTRAVRRQKTAPIVTLSAEFSWPLETTKISEWNDAWDSAWDDRQKPLYTVSLGVDLSPLFSGAGVRDTLIEEKNRNMLEEKKDNAHSREENEKRLLKASLLAIREQNEQYRAALAWSVELTSDAESLADQGGLSALELQSYRLQTLKRETDVSNSEDQTWYLEWYLQWWMD